LDKITCIGLLKALVSIIYWLNIVIQ